MEKKEDNPLKHHWGKVLQIEGENQQGGQAFLTREGLLYYHTKHRGQACDLLVVSRSKT